MTRRRKRDIANSEKAVIDGIDVNADYLELAQRRLAPLLAQPRLLEAIA